MGDSYSTFYGYIPEHYAAYYWQNPDPIHGLSMPEQTWWHQLISENNANLVRNDSWSGSCICHTGYDGEDCSETSSFVYRIDMLDANRFFTENQIDTFFIFGGTNDSWSGAPLGELQFSDWQKSDLYNVLPAICYLMKRAKELIPSANIICVINDGLKAEITEGMKAVCRHYGIRYAELEGIDKIDGHPTPKGMIQIKEQIYKQVPICSDDRA